MPIMATRPKNDFSPAPEGLFQAVCIDVIDLGIVKVEFKGKTKEQHKIKILWALDEVDQKTGKNFWVSQRYTLSLHEKSGLRKMLETWRGVKFTDEELEGFDVEKLIGANCQVQTQHNLTDGTTYANVVAVVKAAKGVPKMAVPSDYVRQCDREKNQYFEEHPNGEGYHAADEDIPF